MFDATRGRRAARTRLEPTGILVGSGLTLLFGGCAAVLGALASPALTLVLCLLACVAAGYVALRFRGGEPVEPAMGAGLLVLVISGLELLSRPALRQAPAWQVVLSLLLSLSFAFHLAWLGGWLGKLARERSHRTSGDARSPIGADAPSSQPAPRSG